VAFVIVVVVCCLLFVIVVLMLKLALQLFIICHVIILGTIGDYRTWETNINTRKTTISECCEFYDILYELT